MITKTFSLIFLLNIFWVVTVVIILVILHHVLTISHEFYLSLTFFVTANSLSIAGAAASL